MTAFIVTLGFVTFIILLAAPRDGRTYLTVAALLLAIPALAILEAATRPV